MGNARVKRALLIVDGLGDLPVPELNNRTPLEAAETPNLNWIASLGTYGFVDPIDPGVVPNTDTGTSLLMGMDPADAHLLRRGPIEAAGVGVTLTLDDVALRANFATAEQNGAGLRITDRRGGRAAQGLRQLAAEIARVDLGDNVNARFYPTDQHRGVVVLSGEALDAAVTDTDPGDAALPANIAEAKATRPEAARTARKVNLFVKSVHQILEQHPVNAERVAAGLLPANCVITRGAGSRSELRNRYVQQGNTVALVAGCNTVLGLGREFNFKLVTSPRFSADTHSDFRAKIKAAVDASDDHDLVIIHVKATDTCAHDLDPVGKMKVIEQLDRALEPMREWQGVFALSADHTTDSNTGRHTADPVPSILTFIGDGSRHAVTDMNFGETRCRTGNLERQNSKHFVDRFLSL